GSRPAIVFIDEIQRKLDAGRFLKGLYDQNLPVKFVATGSGSLELKASVKESLAGRKRIFEVHPVSFREFFNYRTAYAYEEKLSEYFELEQGRAENFLMEYLSFGGYPEVILAETETEKRQTIAELFSSYVEKDIAGTLGVTNQTEFVILIRLLADRSGKPINYTGLANEVNLSLPTLKKYIHYAEETFILNRLNPFFNNIGKELTKSPQYYFEDIGLRNYAAGVFGLLPARHPAIGFVFQHLVFQYLHATCQKNGWMLHYWRTRDKAEVDFVVNRIKDIIPVEVKFRALKKPELTASFQSFLKKYSPLEAFVVNRSLYDDFQWGNTTVHFRPWWPLWDNGWGAG
ncbi:MAG: ATP-binding protein, partial [Sinomicrobium sp.]|nr:ATP-binding protein [Sinomicrobium sp.]